MLVNAIRYTRAEVALCRGMGMSAADLLTEAEIIVNMVDTAMVSEAIAMYKTKDIVVLDTCRACRQHGYH